MLCLVKCVCTHTNPCNQVHALHMHTVSYSSPLYVTQHLYSHMPLTDPCNLAHVPPSLSPTVHQPLNCNPAHT